jgi:hypothetical protein
MPDRSTFAFKALANRYHHEACGDDYPRLRAWEFLWDWVQSSNSWSALASHRRRQQTALHLGLYLAQWGMFRGSSGLLQVNLDFFDAFVLHLFGGKGVNPAFWDLTLKDFEGTRRNEEAERLFAQGVEDLRSFEPNRVTWTSTLTSKVLLGVWGQVPAYDRYFHLGWRNFAAERAEGDLPRTLKLDAQSLRAIAQTRARHRWNLRGYRTFYGSHPYPPGKVIDMAFYQAGLEQGRKS